MAELLTSTLAKWHRLLGVETKEAGKLLNVENPLFVVVGNENCGKSALLNSLLGNLSIFPERAGIATRSPIMIRMRQRDSREKTTVRLEFNGQVFESESVEGLQAIESFRQVVDNQNGNDNRYMLDQMMEMTVSGPSMLNLDFLDLPGLAAIARPGWPEDSVQELESYVRTYLERNSDRVLVLFVCDASSDPTQSLAMRILNDVQRDMLGQRTIGVLSRADNLVDDLWDSNILRFLQDDSAPPFYVLSLRQRVRNPNGGKMLKPRGGQTVGELLSEADFFTEKLTEHSAQDVASRCGMNQLIEAMAHHVDRYFRRRYLNRAIEEANKRKTTLIKRIAGLGDQVNAENRNNILARVNQYISSRVEQLLQREFSQADARAPHTLRSPMMDALPSTLAGAMTSKASVQGNASGLFGHNALGTSPVVFGSSSDTVRRNHFGLFGNPPTTGASSLPGNTSENARSRDAIKSQDDDVRNLRYLAENAFNEYFDRFVQRLFNEEMDQQGNDLRMSRFKDALAHARNRLNKDIKEGARCRFLELVQPAMMLPILGRGQSILVGKDLQVPFIYKRAIYAIGDAIGQDQNFPGCTTEDLKDANEPERIQLQDELIRLSSTLEELEAVR